MSVITRALLAVVWSLHTLFGVHTADSGLTLQVQDITSSSVTLSWRGLNSTSDIYYLQRAPTAFPEPPPRRTDGLNFNLESFVKFSKLKWSISKFTFQLRFRTFENVPSARTLLYVTSETAPETAWVGVNGSYLFVSLNCSGNWSQFNVDLYNTTTRVDWINAVVHANDSNVTVFINEKVAEVFQWFTCNSISTTPYNATAFVGGTPPGTIHGSEESTGNSEVSYGFLGCVGDVRVSGQLLNFTSDSHSGLGRSPCFADIEEGMLFGTGGFVKYSKTINVTDGIRHDLRFKTRRQDWLLVYVNQSDSYYSLRLSKGHLTFTQNENGTMFHVGHPLCDNRWHDVALFCTNTSCSLQYDQVSLSDSLNPLDARLVAASLYMGGFPGGRSNSTPGGYDYKGCLQDRTFIKDTRFIQENVDVDMSGCPVAPDTMSTCAGFIYENKYIGYENSFLDNSVTSNQEYKYRVQANTAKGTVLLSKWVTVRTKEPEKQNEKYLPYLFAAAGFVFLLLVALVIISVLLCRKQRELRKSEINKDRKRTATVGQRYVESQRRPNTSDRQLSGSSIELVERTPEVNNYQNDDIVNQPADQSVIYNNDPTPNLPVYGNVTPRDQLYMNVEDEVSIYGNAEVIRKNRMH